MNTIVDDINRAIAQRIRLEREARGWSLAEMADRSAVSKAAISKIERGETSPTATILVRIAGAFDLTLAGLLIRAEGAGSRLSRAADQPVWRDPETGYIRRQIFVRPDHPVEIVEVQLPPGRRVTMPGSSYAHIRETVLVKSGTLTLIEDNERFDLEAGDCLGFGPPADTLFANETEDPVLYLVVLARS
ncbi:MAG: XRE family transcriptional regulator [Alphaproteobacteria bacterium]|nr:XRE family transcriptional regulator [Alphaproteobacteria bacterium]